MRKAFFLMFLLLVFSCIFFTFPSFAGQNLEGSTQIQEPQIGSQVIQNAKNREVTIQVSSQYAGRGVVLTTGYVLSNDHIPPLNGVKFKIKVNNQEAHIVKRFSGAPDLILLRTETLKFDPVEFKTDFQVGDVVFSLGRSSRISSGQITTINLIRTSLIASLDTVSGDSGSGVWSLDGRLVGLRSGWVISINGEKVANQEQLADIRSTGVSIEKLLTGVDYGFLYR